jgi:hypothetical protein
LAAARLDRLAQERLADALADALDQALGDDATVYVLRQVDSRMALMVHDDVPDARLVERWAEQLAGAVMRQIAYAPNEGTDLVRFTDQADYVARFAADLVQGRASRLWFYGPLLPRQAQPVADTLRTVLLDNYEHLPAILGYLQRYGALEKLLAALDETALQALWSRGLGAHAGPDPASERPLFTNALRLLKRLDLWQRSPPPAETLFQTYLATDPPPADWRDRRGLAVAVLAVLRFLLDRGYLKRMDEVESGALESRLGQALSDLDWLDADWLRTSILDLLGGPACKPPELPVRPSGRGPTPRQRELLNELVALLASERIDLDHTWPNSTANALRLYALLVAHAPRWAGDALATTTIQRLLNAWKWVARSHTLGIAMHRLRQRDVKGAVDTLPARCRSRATGAFEFLVALGEPGLDLFGELVGDELERGKSERAVQAVPEHDRRLVGVAKALELLANLDEGDLSLVKALIGDELRQREIETALQTVSKESRASRVVEALEFLADLDETSLKLIQAFIDGERGWGEVERALQTLPKRSRSRAGAAAAFQALAGLDEAGLNLARTLAIGELPHELVFGGAESGCAGVFLLLRAILDARLPELVKGTAYPPQGGPAPLSTLLVSLGLRWAGEAGLDDGEIDAGLGLLAGLTSPPTLAELQETWSATGPDDHARFQAALLRILAGQRMVRGSVLHLYRLTLVDGHLALVAGDETGELWPLGRVVEETVSIAAGVATWLDLWHATTGQQPAIVVAESLAPALQSVPSVVPVPEVASPTANDADNELAAAHRSGYQALLAALAALEHGRLGVPEADLTVALTATALLRLWARWLSQFATSSIPYLLTQFVRRPGWLSTQQDVILIEMEPRPLDMVIGMAGYMTELERVPWLDQRTVRLRTREL